MSTSADTTKPAAGAGGDAVTAEHALQSSWTLWYDKKQKSGEKKVSFRENLKELGTFYTIEGFWSHYVHLKRPSEFQPDTNVYLFRSDSVPMWESFPQGGCWILKVRKLVGVLGKLWQDLLFGTIGEMFEEPTVVGITMACRRKHDMISVWNSDNTNPEIRFRIGEKLRNILQLDPKVLMEYKFHTQSMHDRSTYSNTDAFVYAPEQDQGAATDKKPAAAGRRQRATAAN